MPCPRPAAAVVVEEEEVVVTTSSTARRRWNACRRPSDEGDAAHATSELVLVPISDVYQWQQPARPPR